DVCLLDLQLMILLILQADHMVSNMSHPEPQVITAVIVAHQHNDKQRLLRLISVDAMTIPCITVVGTQPIFY
ncbi:hypothetical protein EDD22DRAFT_744077, partial [Suillus occidentalis]